MPRRFQQVLKTNPWDFFQTKDYQNSQDCKYLRGKKSNMKYSDFGIRCLILCFPQSHTYRSCKVRKICKMRQAGKPRDNPNPTWNYPSVFSITGGREGGKISIPRALADITSQAPGQLETAPVWSWAWVKFDSISAQALVPARVWGSAPNQPHPHPCWSSLDVENSQVFASCPPFSAMWTRGECLYGTGELSAPRTEIKV